VDTDLLAPFVADAGTKELFTNASPMKRLGTISDVGDATALIASDSARWISGQAICVAGGAKP
jgi:NAD(P)-dependent dehydrogenase (short-subunit alcohol dehydrogenase family)